MPRRPAYAAALMILLASSVVVAAGCPAGAGPTMASLPLTVTPKQHAFVAVTLGGLAGSVRIEPDSDVSYLLNTARERLGLGLRDGMALMPAFQLDGAMTEPHLVTVASPDQQQRWLAERPDLLAVIGMDVLRAQPLRFDPVRGVFGWGAYLREETGQSLALPMQAKVPGVPVIEARIDGRPVRLRVEPWAAGLMVHGESELGRQVLGAMPFQPQVRWGRYNWAMPKGEHAVIVGGRPVGRAVVNVLAPYVIDPEVDREQPFVIEGWQGVLAPASLPGWSIVIDYPEQKVRLQPLVPPGR